MLVREKEETPLVMMLLVMLGLGQMRVSILEREPMRGPVMLERVTQLEE